MNSRGKPLTDFENFKAELEKYLTSTISENKAKEFISNIDTKWTNLLWKLRNKDSHLVDPLFINYFKFICSIIYFTYDDIKNKNITKNLNDKGLTNDPLDLIEIYFKEDYLPIFENYFNCFIDTNNSNYIEDFFNSFIYIKNNFDVNKIKISYLDTDKNFLRFCVNQSDLSLGATSLLYAIIQYLLNKDKISIENFRRRIRIISNILKNSEFELRSDRMSLNLQQISDIMLHSKLPNDTKVAGLNNYQLQEEILKLEYTNQHSSKENAELFKLEDHDLLYGQISILGLENIQYASKFIELFKNNNYDVINKALLSIDNYGQQERNIWRYQYACNKIKSWQNLFHKSSNRREDYDCTKNCLTKLLKDCNNIDTVSLQAYIDKFISTCQLNSYFPINYYFVKYNVFRPNAHGKYYVRGDYYIYALTTKAYTSKTTYLTFLKAVVNELNDDNIYVSDYNNTEQYINYYEKIYIYMNYDQTEQKYYFAFYDNDDKELDNLRTYINQKNKIDTVDRVQLLTEIIKGLKDKV